MAHSIRLTNEGFYAAKKNKKNILKSNEKMEKENYILIKIKSQNINPLHSSGSAWGMFNIWFLNSLECKGLNLKNNT